MTTNFPNTWNRGFALVSLLSILFSLMSNSAMSQSTFRDNFSSVSYSNNDGTANWASDWIETGDTDLGPTNQYIYISGNRLNLYYLYGETISRAVDLGGATSATLSFTWQTSGLTGSKAMVVQISTNGGASYTTIGSFNGNNGSGSFNQNILTYATSNTVIRFTNNGNNWDSNDYGYIDNVQISANLSARLSIADVTVNEGDGTAVFTVSHGGANASGAFTVDYGTTDGTALAGSDFTAVSGTLSFSGTTGDTEQIVVPITDDTTIEGITENFTVQLGNSSDPAIVLPADATGSIDDNDVLGNTPLALFYELNGYVDYTTTGGTLRTNDNNTNACSITTTSSNTLTAPIPVGATIEKAFLYWAHSNATPDAQVTFEGNTVNADIMYTTSITNRVFYGGVADVTSIITGIGSPGTNTYDFSGLTIDNSSTYCDSATVLGGWSLFIFYSDDSLPASTVNLYQGFNGESNSSSSFTLGGFFAIGATGSKTSVLSWEGDQTLSNNELLSVTTGLGTFTLSGDGDNDGTTVNNPFNSTIYDNTIAPVVNNATTYGVDLDTYDVSPYVTPGESSVTTNVQSGQDFVVMNALVLKVPSNLITGTVFEDVNYGGGAGRNLASASGVEVPGATVELYDNTGSFVSNTTTNAVGAYTFGGMANGTYSVRVVNSTVTSSRGGGSACSGCIPVQTFKTDFFASALIEDPNEVGGANPSAVDSGAGTFAGAQSLASITIANEGAVGLDFGFNFNTIVNTNEDGQGSLEQFIVNSNALDETGLNIVANALFDPAAGEDTSIFMIPTTGDPLGRTADPNFSGGYFDISISNANPLSQITAANTMIDGRTQTAYSGDTNSGTIGAGGTSVGTSGTLLQNFELPEIQVHRNGGDVFRIQGDNDRIRNLSVYANNRTAILFDDGSGSTVSNCLLGTNASGSNAGNILYGVEIEGTTVNNLMVSSNYIATVLTAGIFVNGGSGTKTIQGNHLFAIGDNPCDVGIDIQNGSSGVLVQNNLIENSQGIGIKSTGGSGGVSLQENTITTSGQNTGNCSGSPDDYGISLLGNDNQVLNNVIFDNGGAGLVVSGSTTTGNLISQNSFYNNGANGSALGIDLNGDGVTLNDSGDTDSGPNGLLNFPIIEAAFKSGNNIIVSGWSRPGATIEFFLTDINQGTATAGDNQLGMVTDYGEGQVFLGSAVEGSGADANSATASYTDDDGNTDNTNKFRFTFAVGPGAVLGDDLTATATISNSTSEFSPFSKLRAYSVITNRRITYRVKKD